MKKIAALLAVVLCLCALAAPVSALAKNGSYGKVPMYDGKITVDGKLDDIYKKGLVVEITGDYPGNYASDSTGKAYLLHDGKYIYLAIEMKSAYPIAETYDASIGTAAHKGTGCEMYFDFSGKGDKAAGYYKYTGWHNSQLFPTQLGKAEHAEFKGTVDVAKKTYVLELKVALQDGAKTGSSFGFYLMANDCKDLKAPNQNYIAVPKQMDQVKASGDPSVWFDITLDSAKVALDTTAATTKAPAAKPTSPATFDAGIVMAVVAAAAGAGAVVSKRKH